MASFLDRTVAARRYEKPAASTTGIIPGDRGMVGGSWCCRPLQCRVSGAGRQISPAPLAGVVSGQFIHESGAERQGVIRNRVQAESGPRAVSTRAPTQLPQRVMVATVQTRTQSRFPAGQPPPKGPVRPKRAGRARATRRRGVSGPGKARQPPQWGSVKKHAATLQKRTQPES